MYLISNTILSLGGSCKHATSAIGSTPVLSTAIVRLFHLPQFYWVGIIVRNGCSQLGLTGNLSSGHDSHLFHEVLFPGIIGLLMGYQPPYLAICFAPLSGLEHCSVTASYPHPLSSIQLQSPALPHHSDGLGFPPTLDAECNMIPLAVRALLLQVAQDAPFLDEYLTMSHLWSVDWCSLAP